MNDISVMTATCIPPAVDHHMVSINRAPMIGVDDIAGIDLERE